MYALDGQIAGVQRKRHLGEDEDGYAESGVDDIWDAMAAGGAPVLFLCSAPGLHGRRTDEASWRAGCEWWEGSGLADARHHARRLARWVAMATQAGSTVDEDFPGIAALVAPSGEIVERLPGWRPGTLVVDIPVTTDVDPVRWSIRVLVIDEEGRTLLAQFGDDRTGSRWWVPPGGGIEAGEDDDACARRELREELGRDDLVVGGCIGRRGGSFLANGAWSTQYERWYICRCAHFDVADEVVARVRSEGVRDLRWWSSDEMRAARIDTGPSDLPHLLDEIVAGHLPAADADLGR